MREIQFGIEILAVVEMRWWLGLIAAACHGRRPVLRLQPKDRLERWSLIKPVLIPAQSGMNCKLENVSFSHQLIGRNHANLSWSFLTNGASRTRPVS